LIEGESYTLMTQDMAGITRRQLGNEGIDLDHFRSDILAAIDFLLSKQH
jgi:toxin CcdB